MEQKIWWYSLNNEQKGPVSEEQLNLLYEQNFINPDTPVWKEGLANWINFSDINAPVEVAPQRPPLPPVFSKPVVAQAQAANVPLVKSNGGSAQGYSQIAVTPPDYNTLSNASQPNYNTQSNGSHSNYNTQGNQANVNGHGATSLPERLNYISDLYYRVEFEKIMNSNETYKGKFNWWAFFFSWVWCFTKGLWQFGLAVLIVATIANFYLPFNVSAVLNLGLAIFSGMRGTYFYYNYKMNSKQFF